MRKLFFAAVMLLMGGLLHAQVNNPFASKGEMVAPSVRSAAVGESQP